MSTEFIEVSFFDNPIQDVSIGSMSMSTSAKIGYTTEEALEYLLNERDPKLEISHSILCRYCRSGDLPAIKHGRDWIIEKRDLDKFEPNPRGNPAFRQQKSRRKSS